MIIKQYQKPYVPKYANYDYTKVYDGNNRFIGWIKIYYELVKVRNDIGNDGKYRPCDCYRGKNNNVTRENIEKIY